MIRNQFGLHKIIVLVLTALLYMLSIGSSQPADVKEEFLEEKEFGFGELPGPANDRSLHLCQGAVERVLLARQLEGLLLQLVPLRFQLLHLAGVNQSLGIEWVPVPLLQLLGPLHDELLHLLVLATERCGKLLVTRGEVLLLGV